MGVEMDASFWLQRWQQGQIGFHEAQGNSLLLAHFAALDLPAGARIFVPLCGKSRDIGWLLAQGFEVVAAELSQIAIDQLFAELGVAPQITLQGDLWRYEAVGLVVFVGDIFALTPDLLGQVDAVYDRAALVALPTAMREAYSAHLVALSAAAPQLLISFGYDQSQTAGPPFSVPGSEVARLYGQAYDINLLADLPAKGGIRGTPAQEVVWHLSRKEGI